ncbi:MAG: hypothetical protein WDM77_12070 [Steroidobacteraceae bacterium]
MCDQDDFDQLVQYQRRAATVSRRQFGALSVGAGLLSLVPAGAYAAETTGADVEIKTPDGTCDAYFVHPAKGKHRPSSSGPTFSVCVRRSRTWPRVWPVPATRCS